MEYISVTQFAKKMKCSYTIIKNRINEIKGVKTIKTNGKSILAIPENATLSVGKRGRPSNQEIIKKYFSKINRKH